MINYEKLMWRCLELAKNGEGHTSPNPMVGCVVLDKNNSIISEGYHHKYGESHAERDALLKLTDGSEKDGTLIVNLEPCSHYGKTPPCADLIIERRIKKVVIGCRDNNPKVNGGGIKKLQDAEIEVITGVLEAESRKLNEVFFTDVEQNRLFVALKTATTIDGKIATSTGDSKWITSSESRDYARTLRKKYDAILTSSASVIADNPEMKHKQKIILDTNFKTNFDYKIYQQGDIILVTSENFNNLPLPLPDNVTLLKCKTNNNKIDLNDLTQKLYEMKIKSIFVEAGSKLSGDFIKNVKVDKVYHFVAPKILNDNSGKSCFDGDFIQNISETKCFKTDSVSKIGNDILITYCL